MTKKDHKRRTHDVLILSDNELDVIHNVLKAMAEKEPDFGRPDYSVDVGLLATRFMHFLDNREMDEGIYRLVYTKFDASSVDEDVSCQPPS